MKRRMQYIEKVHLTRFADAYPHTLSGGMKQRVAIARGMAMEPDILLMDEPFAALDALTRRRMQDELLALWEETRFTVLFVTHSIPEAVKIGNRILLLSPHPGQVKAELNSLDRPASDPAVAMLEARIHDMLFADRVEEESACLTRMSAAPRNRPRAAAATQDFGIIEKAADASFERLYNQVWVRKTFLILMLVVSGKLYARHLDNPLLVPTLTRHDQRVVGRHRFRACCRSGVWTSLQVLASGFTTGVVLAVILTVLAITTRIGTDFLETMTAMFNPLPAIALLPLALIWFGLGIGSLVFVLVHSVLWAVALNTHAGFRGCRNTMRMVGRNYGLSGLGLVFRILIPAAFPSILAGLKIGWAFAWRTLIAAELVFGVASGKGGLGWYIFESKNELDIPKVFAGLLTIIMIGLIVENVIFRTMENRTVRRWGMQT